MKEHKIANIIAALGVILALLTFLFGSGVIYNQSDNQTVSEKDANNVALPVTPPDSVSSENTQPEYNTFNTENPADNKQNDALSDGSGSPENPLSPESKTPTDKQQNNNSTDTNNKSEHNPMPAQNQTTNPQDNAPGDNNTFIPEEKHIISFDNHEYPGAITPSQWTAVSGDTISILLEPSDGYVIEPFQEVGLYKGTDNKWYFTMPDCDISFTVKPQNSSNPKDSNTYSSGEKHIISFDNHEYPGAITPSQWTAVSGDTISILLEPSDGYVIEPFQEVGLYKGTDNKWYFTMPDCDTSFKVSPN